MTGLGAAMEAFYADKVDFEVGLMANKVAIADEFADGFRRSIGEKMAPFVVAAVLHQGSAFEGLKVERPDEFDYAILLEVDDSKFNLIEGRNLRNGNFPGYWSLVSKGTWIGPDPWKRFLNETGYLSPDKVRHVFHGLADKYANAYNEHSHRVVYRSFRGSPAFSFTIESTNPVAGFSVSVDLSPCLAVTSTGFIYNSYTRYLVFKSVSHNTSSDWSVQSFPLWMNTNSKQEMDYINQLSDGHKKCARILKAAFISMPPFRGNHMSYIVKTAWLHVVDSKRANRHWSNDEARADRMLDILVCIEENFKDKAMMSRFNLTENILDRYSDKFIETTYGYLRRLNNKWRNGNMGGFIDELFREQRGYLPQEPEQPESWCRIM